MGQTWAKQVLQPTEACPRSAHSLGHQAQRDESHYAPFVAKSIVEPSRGEGPVRNDKNLAWGKPGASKFLNRGLPEELLTIINETVRQSVANDDSSPMSPSEIGQVLTARKIWEFGHWTMDAGCWNVGWGPQCTPRPPSADFRLPFVALLAYADRARPRPRPAQGAKTVSSTASPPQAPELRLSSTASGHRRRQTVEILARWAARGAKTWMLPQLFTATRGNRTRCFHCLFARAAPRHF